MIYHYMSDLIVVASFKIVQMLQNVSFSRCAQLQFQY